MIECEICGRHHVSWPGDFHFVLHPNQTYLIAHCQMYRQPYLISEPIPSEWIDKPVKAI